MPVSAPAGRISEGSTPADEESLIPPFKAAQGPPAAVCRECGVTVRFANGFAPKPVSWADGICPACTRDRIRRMSDEEQREVLMEAFRRDPTLPADVLAKRTGSRLARKVRREAVKMGIAERLNWNGKTARAAKPAPRPKPKRTLKVEADAEKVRAAVLAEPGSGAGDVADKVGIPRTTARRHLRALVDAGEVRTTKEGRNVRYFPSESG